MSLPSIPTILSERALDPLALTKTELEEVIVESMRRDLSLGVAYIHRLAHEAKDRGNAAFGNEDPNSRLGKQLVRICAGTVLRELAEKHFCHGMQLAFLNCCGPVVAPQQDMPDKKTLMLRQLHMQDGTIAHADC